MHATTNQHDKVSGGMFVPLYRTDLDPRAECAEEIMVAFEREHGEAGEHVQNLAQLLSYLRCWCDANGFQWDEAMNLSRSVRSEEAV